LNFLSQAVFFSLMLVFGVSCLAAAQDRYNHLPNPRLTPGDAHDVTREGLCKSGDPDLVGNIPIAVKRQVFDLYGIGAGAPGGYNVDHLIPVGLGGTNSIKNLWPQPLAGKWGYSAKNRLERKLRKMVCGGELELETARREIATDWVSAHKKYLGEPGQAPSAQK
jgi:hypothetical protein